MTGKKILIICHLIHPAQNPRAFRATELAKELAKLGHSVKLYAVLGSFDYRDFEAVHGLKIRNLGKMIFATPDSDDNNTYSIFVRILNRLFGRLLEFPNIELAFRVPRVIRIEKRTDLLISVGAPYPIHWGCALSKQLRKRNFPPIWIADCGDPYMANNLYQEKRKYFYFKYIEKWFCRLADYIVVPFEGAKEGYYPEFRHKIRVIPQGFNFDHINIYTERPVNKIPTFAYSGVFFKEIRNPSAFFAHLSTIDLDFKFVIYTKTPEIIAPYLDSLSHKVEIHGYIPREKLIYELSKMDFLVNFDNKTNIHLPSKLIDYALAKRPILSIPSNVLPVEIINEFLHGNYQHQYIVKELDQYNITNVAREFISLS